MEEKIGGRPHRLMMEDRGKMSITGIADVVSFDENQVVLDTDKGLLTIKGKDLCVSRLTLEKGGIFHSNPVFFIYFYPLFDFIIQCFFFTLDHNTSINLIF